MNNLEVTMNTSHHMRTDAPERGITPVLVPLKQATEMIGLHDTRTTMRLVRTGQLKARKIGNRILITVKSINEFAEA